LYEGFVKIAGKTPIFLHGILIFAKFQKFFHFLLQKEKKRGIIFAVRRCELEQVR
jgi:hypothetical protein